jgi:SAM-dependent methyltransferase
MSEWYKDWFNTRFYHILYKNHNFDEAENFIRHIVSQLNLISDASVLDLACGRGRHSIYLNKLGYKVLGVDLSDENIRNAKLFEREGLNFHVHDMRLPIDARKFDVVLNLFTSFGYFEDPEDDQRVIDSVSQSLNPNGYLIIDFMNVNCVISRLVKDFQVEEEGIVFNISKKVEENFIVKNIKFCIKEKDYRYAERVRKLRLQDFEKMLSKSGFEISDIYGDYNLSTFDENTSDRLIIKARLK